MARLLFITPYIPLATKPRPFRFIEHLSRSHEVHLAAFDVAPDGEYQSRPDFQRLQRWCASVALIPLPKWRRYLNVLASIPTLEPARAAYYHQSGLARLIMELVSRHHIEVIHVDRLRLARHFAHIPAPKVVDATDSISDYLRQCVPYVSPPMRPAYQYEALKTVAFERTAARDYACCLVTTEREASLYAHTEYASRVRAVPNILNTALFERPMRQDGIGLGIGGPTMLFTGNLSYLPNVDAARYLLERIWPRIVARAPSARLILAGATPHPSVRRAARTAGAHLTGFVPDLTELVAQSTVVVSPMRIGVGFPNKVAEAMALGKAIVSTPVGCQGLTGSDSALAVASAPEEFSDTVLRLLADPVARQNLGQRAREYSFQTFHPAIVTAQLDRIFDSLTTTTTAAPMA